MSKVQTIKMGRNNPEVNQRSYSHCREDGEVGDLRGCFGKRKKKQG